MQLRVLVENLGFSQRRSDRQQCGTDQNRMVRSLIIFSVVYIINGT